MARKLVLKEYGLNDAGNSPNGYRYIGYDGTTVSDKSGATVSSLGGSNTKITAFTCNMVTGSITNLVFQRNDHDLSISNFFNFDNPDSHYINKTNGWDIDKVIVIGNCTGDDGTLSYSVSFNKNGSNNDIIALTRGYNLSTNLTIKIEEF